jgi:hypothetical protein
MHAHNSGVSVLAGAPTAGRSPSHKGTLNDATMGRNVVQSTQPAATDSCCAPNCSSSEPRLATPPCSFTPQLVNNSRDDTDIASP